MARADTTQALKRTPFHGIHERLGAKIVPFAGYEMPVQYPTGITAEHKAVRERAGLFDVSHMGEFIVRGPQAVEFVNHVTTNNVAALAVGQIQYSGILNEGGTFEDDCLVYRFADHLMVVVNASNAAKDLEHIERYKGRFDCTLEDVSDDVALLALQGPESLRVLRQLTDTDLAAIQYYHFVEGTVAGVPDVIISRTGYTGEDGFELYFDPARSLPSSEAKGSGQAGLEHGQTAAEVVWNALVADPAVVPAGLGSRDSLRLEMGMALYGNDIDDTVTPYEAGLGWIVKLQKGDFVGRDALVAQKERGVERKLVGFTTSERAFPRQGYPVHHAGAPCGDVRSGTMSPTLGTPIGTCYLPSAATAEGTEFEIEIRGKRVPARVVKTPFYKRPGAR